MISWFNQLNDLQQVFALIAIPSSIIMVLQTILLLIGVGDGMDSGTGGGWGKDAGCWVDARAGVGSAEGQSSFELEGFGADCGDGVETSSKRDFGRRDYSYQHRVAGCRVICYTIYD